MQRTLRSHNTRVVDEDIEAMKGALHLFRERFYGMQVRDITLDGGALVPAISNRSGGLFEWGRRAPAENGVRAKRRERRRNRGSYAAPGTSDHGDLPR